MPKSQLSQVTLCAMMAGIIVVPPDWSYDAAYDGDPVFCVEPKIEGRGRLFCEVYQQDDKYALNVDFDGWNQRLMIFADRQKAIDACIVVAGLYEIGLAKVEEAA